MKALLGTAVLILLGLQYSIWFGQSGYFARERLRDNVAAHARKVDLLRERNKILAAQVMALKNDASVLESRARQDLGYIKAEETFYLIPDRNM
ncbi:MAG: septum formation initiator family protein [Pseudomonadota bacterium]